MSSNNNNNGGSNGGGNRNNNNRQQQGNQNNNNNSNNNRRRNNKSNNKSSNNNQKVKGATEALGYNVFDCSTRKSLEACNETLKQIAIYVGKEYGKNASTIKYVVENLKDPDLKEPDVASKMLQTQMRHITDADAIETYERQLIKGQ